MLSESEERKPPMILTSAFYLLNYYLLSKMPIHSGLKVFLLGTCVGVVIALIVNMFWKISTHAIGIGGILGVLLGLSFRMHYNLSVLIIVAVLLFGFIGFARLKLNAHSPGQIYVGFAVGIISEAALYFIF